jgi:hypothetical protein
VFGFFKSPAAASLKSALKKRTPQATTSKPSKEEVQKELRKEAEPFGLPDEDLVVADVNEAMGEIKDLRERKAHGASTKQVVEEFKAKRVYGNSHLGN